MLCRGAASITVGFVILAAAHEGSALFELLDQLYHRHDSFAIHVDAKGGRKAAALTQKLKRKFPRGNLVVSRQLWGCDIELQLWMNLLGYV